MKKSMIGLSLLALGLAGSAFAAETMQSGDAMGDKTMTKAEFMAKGADLFAKMDANRDGKLDTADRAARQGAKFDQLDTNTDGNVSRDEFIAAHARGGMHDAGKMEAGNMDHGNMDHGKMDHGNMAGGGKHGGRYGKAGGMGHAGGHGGMMMLKMADTNGDNAVSKDEFAAAQAKHFDMIDTDRDGQVTKAERQAAHQKMRGMGGMRGMRYGQPDGDKTPMPAPAN